MQRYRWINIVVLATAVLFFLNAGCLMPHGPVQPSDNVPEATGWDIEVVVDNLEHPWSIAWLPDASILITERPGRIKIIHDGIVTNDIVEGLPAIFVSGQGGLLDVSLHPDFETNRYVYLVYASGTEDANRTTVGRGRLEGNMLIDFKSIFRVSQDKSGGQHFGSRMLWLPGKTFLLSIGDGGNRPESLDGEFIRNQAQNLSSHLGKILHMKDDGTPADDNPFLNHEGALPEIWTLGHRNVQGLALDPETGRVWANEHGSRGGDELNLIKGGRNYGWPIVTYSREYFGPRISDKTSKTGMEDPKIVWTPAQSPSGLAFYTGDRYPDWKDNLFSGGLRGEQVRRIILDGENVSGEESLTIGRRVRDIHQGPDGYLYLLTDEENGSLLRIIPVRN